MATPEGFNLNLLPSADDFNDSTVYEAVLSVAQSEDMPSLKQQLANYRRKRTNAYNAIKDIRQRMAAADPADTNEEAETLLTQSLLWSDAKLAVKMLEDLEEHHEHYLVFGTQLTRPSRLVEPTAPVAEQEGESSPPKEQGPPPPPPQPPVGQPAGSLPPAVVSSAKSSQPFLTPLSTASYGNPAAAASAAPSRRPTSSQVSKVDLPELADKFSLQHHLSICEALMAEAELGAVVNKILTSLKPVADISSLASSTAEQQNYDWPAVRQVLLATFAKRESLLMQLREVVGGLKFSNIDKFYADARKIHAMVIRLFGADNYRASALISEVHRVARLQAYTPDWSLAVPFDGTETSLLGILNRLERQEVAARILTARGISASAELAVAALASQPDLWGDALRQKIPEMLDSFALRGRKRKFPLFRIVALPKDCDRKAVLTKLKEIGYGRKLLTVPVGPEQDCKLLPAERTEGQAVYDLRSLPVDSSGSAAPKALWLHCLLEAADGSRISVPALVDTGAGLNFLVAPRGYASSCQKRWITLSLSVHLKDGLTTPKAQHCFYVLHGPELSSRGDMPLLIAGRRLLSDLKVSVMANPSRVLLDGREVAFYPAPSAKSTQSHCLALVAHRERQGDAGIQESERRVLEPIEATSDDIVDIPFGEAPAVCTRLLDDLVARSWEPMRSCPGWEARLRALQVHQLRDNPAQSHVFELRCMSVAAGHCPVLPASSRRAATGAYSRLSPAEKAKFDQLVLGYEKRKWWVRCDETQLTDLAREEYVLDPSIVLMVPAGPRRKAGLVVDLRRANRRLKKGSSPSIDVSTCISTVRLHSSGCMLLLDAVQAFYRLRWVHMRALLLVRERLYLSDRCVFGISTGPGSLSHTLGALAEAFRLACRDDFHLLLNDFADDILCAGENAAKAVCWLIYVMARCGFTVGSSKFQPLATSRMKLLVLTVLSKLGLPAELFAWHPEVSLLGCTLSYDEVEAGTFLVVSCGRQERLDAARAQIEQLVAALDGDAQASRAITKAFIFSCGGNLAYDSGGVHAVERAIAAALRSCFARVFAADDWKRPCDLRQLPEAERAAVRGLAEWILELTSPELLSQPCSHRTPTRNDADPIELEVVSDASATGAGYVISVIGKDGARYVIANGAWRFTSAQRVYHSNRRELAVCCKAVHAAADLLSHFKSRSTGLPLIHLVVRSDNRPTVAWLQGEGTVSRSSLERRAVLRTLNALKDELDFLRSISGGGQECGIEIEHIAGTANSEADGLSRLFERLVPTGGSEVLPDTAEYPDVFDEPHSDRRGISWLMTEADERVCQQVDIFQALSYIHLDPTLDGLPGPADADAVDLAASPIDAGDNEPILTHLCNRNWDINGVISDFDFLRSVFHALRPKARQRQLFRALRPAEVLREESRECMMRALQQDLKPVVVKAAGPHVVSKEGIYCFRNGSPDGGYALLPILPRSDDRCLHFRRKLLLDAHRRSAHGGIGSTVSRISYAFHLPGLQRARRAWRQPPGLSDSRKEQLKWEPYHDVYIDFLHLGE
ncbi:hypothetical protein FOL46_000347, partial [Perkinsus olseni]